MNSYTFPAPSLPLTQLTGPYARILATAQALPEDIVTNQALIATHGHRVAPETMHKLVGVSERRVAPLGMADSDLLCLAAQQCLQEAQVPPNALGKLIVTKFLGDRILPMTASLLQRKLGCDTAIQAFDVDGGIHGFIQALEVAMSSIAIGGDPVLIVSGGVINRLISRTDPRLAFQYGDAAAAILLGHSDKPQFLARYGFSNLEYIELARGFTIREDVKDGIHETRNYESLHELYHQKDPRASFEFAKTAMKHTADCLLEQAGRSQNEVDLFLITETHHQLHAAIIDHLKLEPSRTLSLLPRLGNTMSAMLPLLLDEAIRTQKVTPGSLVMLLSVGEGISGGGVLLTI